jgi:fatty-acyl-CoA synthase
MMGAIFEPLIIALPKEVNINVINRAGSKLMFIDESSIPLFEGIKEELKAVNTYIIMTDKKELPQTKLPNVYSYEELMAKASSDYTFPEDLDEDSPALLANTTGTTGPPKLFMHSHRDIVTQAVELGMVDTAALCRDDVFLLAMPMWYFNGWNMQFAATLVGAKLVLPSFPDATQAGELIEREKVTVTQGLSSWTSEWIGAWEKEGWPYALSSVNRMMAALSSRMSMSVARDFFNRTGIRLFCAQGFSEACPLSGAAIPKGDKWEDVERVIRTDGIISPLTKYKVINPKGEEVKHDGKERGMLAVKGPHVIEEYYKDPEATAKNFDKEGYFYSGDMATVDEEGYVTLKERVEDLIRVEAGFIPPGELEGVLGELPKVHEVAAIGVPHGEFERPLVCVLLRDEYKGKVSEQELRKEFEGKVPQSWMPEVIFIEEMPRGPTGKFSRVDLKKQFAGE